MSVGTLETLAVEDLDLDLEVVVVEQEQQFLGAASITLTCAAICNPPTRAC
ncbi:hypothetical protein [Amycolatopsis anabasis]|uniref:hypothetical protein n=1 Tax=Amycolatopsis anabasis TaxID=1840409 RepID=UPI00131D19E3|nr:hypothetical protein [Amycolatopsis anabasis]